MGEVSLKNLQYSTPWDFWNAPSSFCERMMWHVLRSDVCRQNVGPRFFCLRSFNVFFISAFLVITLFLRPLPHRFLFRPRFSRVHAAVSLTLQTTKWRKNTPKNLSSYASYIDTEINLTLSKAFVLSLYVNVAINLRSPWGYWLYYITCQQNRRSAPAKMTDNFNWKSKP